MRKGIVSLARLAPYLLLLLPLLAWGRGGGGQHYTRGDEGGADSPDSDGGGAGGHLIYLIIRLTFAHPQIMCPLLMISGLVYYLWQRNNNPTTRTRHALEQREAAQRTQVSSREVEGWVGALKLKDPEFDLLAFLDKAKRLFLDLQGAWFRRELTPLRPFLSDATFQRFNVQLRLLEAQGVRNAITDIQVMDLQIIGLDQSPWFDTVLVRIKAQMRDTDLPERTPDEQAVAAARRAPLEPFTEVWSFVRKPGAKTKIGADLYQGKCPNCGAPFAGGAANRCEYCGAVVNSGNYDWTLAEITQGIEHVSHSAAIAGGLAEARELDPALNLEALEDRASLLFWRWIDAQSRGEARRLSKVAQASFVEQLEAELGQLKDRGRRRVFLQCAVGGVTTRLLRREGAHQQAHVEVRWSARMGVAPEGELLRDLPTVPQRWVFVLTRKAGATTRTENGMSTDRCPQCGAPLTDSASPSCDFCGALLSDGERDWVLSSAGTWEAWSAAGRQPQGGGAATTVPDVLERERLLYMMAALAAADGDVSAHEAKLLRLCAQRWSIPWSKVEVALRAGPQLFDRLLPRASPEAEAFLRSLVELALVDGKIDRKERHMLQAAAQHLGVSERLPALLDRR